MGDTESFKVTQGKEHVKVYRAKFNAKDPPHELVESTHERHFCSLCGSHLWAYDERWSKWIYPLASAIDTELPQPKDRTHLMTEFKAPWVVLPSEDAHNKV